MKASPALTTIGTLFGSPCVLALDPSRGQPICRRLGLSGTSSRSVIIYALAQTADGYLWFGMGFGLFRFDGVRSIPDNRPRVCSSFLTRTSTLCHDCLSFQRIEGPMMRRGATVRLNCHHQHFRSQRIKLANSKYLLKQQLLGLEKVS